jgi:hypothetical protein
VPLTPPGTPFLVSSEGFALGTQLNGLELAGARGSYERPRGWCTYEQLLSPNGPRRYAGTPTGRLGGWGGTAAAAAAAAASSDPAARNLDAWVMDAEMRLQQLRLKREELRLSHAADASARGAPL